MGESVSGILETFYGDMIGDYPCEDGKEYERQRERSFLYRAFWAENVSWLLKRLDRALAKYIQGHGAADRALSDMHDMTHPEHTRNCDAGGNSGAGENCATGGNCSIGGNLEGERNPLEKYMEPCGKNTRPGSWDFPWTLAQSPGWRPKAGVRIRRQLAEAMRDYPEWAGDDELLLGKKPGKGERRDFWEKLWCDDARYRAGLISDTQYYRWLVKYLAARDVYYKDTGMCDGHVWLYSLLFTGLKGTEDALEPDRLCRDGRNIRTKTEVGQDLAKLAKRIEETEGEGGKGEKPETEGEKPEDEGRGPEGEGEKPADRRAEIDARLHNIGYRVRNGRGGVRREDYMLWLNARLERMAIHIKIRTWLQDSGYSARNRKGEESPKEARKREFSLQLFERYCESEEGYVFSKKTPGLRESWRMFGGEFCALGLSQADALRESLEQGGPRDLYIPLAVHLESGCVFFLAGKENYREVYERAGTELRQAYEEAEAGYCFDYLRPDRRYRRDFPGDLGGAFRLQPFFHENQGRSCEAVFADFRRDCLSGAGSFRQAVRDFNEEAPAGIPDAFRWAFEYTAAPEEKAAAPDGRKPSLQSMASFYRTREAAKEPY